MSYGNDGFKSYFLVTSGSHGGANTNPLVGIFLIIIQYPYHLVSKPSVSKESYTAKNYPAPNA